MKKWYVIIGILVLALVVSISECGGNSTRVDRLRGEVSQYKAELTEIERDYEELQHEYTVLQGTKEMIFGKGIRLFDIHWKDRGSDWGHLEGKVQNIGDKPMKRINIVVVSYNKDGSIREFERTGANALFPEEVAEWSVYYIQFESDTLESKPEQVLAIYAFGNR